MGLESTCIPTLHYAAFRVLCMLCMEFTLYTVLRVRCTLCMLSTLCMLCRHAAKWASAVCAGQPENHG